MRIIETAEFLACLQTIRYPVEAFLLRWCWGPVRERTDYNKPRFKTTELQISSRVQELLPIAIKLRCEELYRDCFVHFVGMLQFAEDMKPQYTDEGEPVEELENVLLQLPTSTAKAILKGRRGLQELVNGALNAFLDMFTDDWGCKDSTDRFHLIMFTHGHSTTEKFRELLADKDAEMAYLFDPETLPDFDNDFLLGTLRQLSVSRLEHAQSHVYRHFVCAEVPDELPWDVFAE